MATKRRFEKGNPITSLDELYKQEWVMWGDSPRHMGFVGSMQLRTVARLMGYGYFSYAIDTRIVVEIEEVGG